MTPGNILQRSVSLHQILITVHEVHNYFILVTEYGRTVQRNILFTRHSLLLLALCSTLSLIILVVRDKAPGRYVFVDILFCAASKLCGSVSKVKLAKEIHCWQDRPGC